MSDSLDQKLREAADAAITGVDVAREAVKYLQELALAIEAGKLVWRDAESPKGSRALEGSSEQFNVMVVQYYTGRSIEHSGMFTVKFTADVNVIVMPKPYAEWVYRKVQTARN